MALFISKATKYGRTANYWRIANITADYCGKQLQATMQGFARSPFQEEYALAQIGVRLYKIGYIWYLDIGDEKYVIGEEFNLPEDVTRAWLYGLISELSSWKNAQNC